MHAVERNLMVAAYLGADIRSILFPLPARSQDEQEIDFWLQDAGVQNGEKLVAIAPVDRLGVRSWPLERFVAVAAALSRHPGVRIVLIGTPGQRWVAKEFQQSVGSRLVDLVGKTRIRQLSALLKRMHLVIANDSAPMHIAAAVGAPVLGLFGPSSPDRGRPFGEQHAVLKAELPCSPCGLSICKNQNQLECLTSIEVGDVVEKAGDMLRRNDGLCRSESCR
jgi:ADP-heptose:LPS heptosyltransferase